MNFEENIFGNLFDNLMDKLDIGTIRNIELEEMLAWAEEMDDNPHLLQPLLDEILEKNSEENQSEENQSKDRRRISEMSFSADLNLDTASEPNFPTPQPIILINKEIPVRR